MTNNTPHQHDYLDSITIITIGSSLYESRYCFGCGLTQLIRLDTSELKAALKRAEAFERWQHDRARLDTSWINDYTQKVHRPGLPHSRY